MKKVVTLVLVLSMVSMAGAALTFTGPTTVAQGGTVNLALAAGVGDLVSGFIWVDYSSYTGQLSNAVMTDLVTNKGGLSDLHLSTNYLPDGIQVTVSEGPGETAIPVGGDIVTFTLSDLEGSIIGDTYLVELLDASFGSTGLSTTITVVPEPATMALLGLGGLLLRRKKA